MIRDVSREQLSDVRDLLQRANDAPYDIATVAEEKCFEAGYEGQPRARVYGDFEGIAVTCGKYLRILAVDRSSRGRGIGTALLKDSGATVIAAEPGNYFTPGVPDAIAGFFRKRGYAETARTQNLVCESGGQAILPVLSDRENVLDFIEQNFGPVWRFEAAKGKTIFHVKDGDRIVGFSTHEANNRGLGFFGPTGVAEPYRGRGYGRALLLASLADLGRLGYHRAVIPWTDAIEFYQKTCRATIDHRFVILRKKSA